MTRHCLSLISAIILLASAQAFGNAAAHSQRRASATLLELYRMSDTVLLGRFDKRVEGKTTRVGDGYTVVSIDIHYDITTVLKGEPRKFLVLDDEEYRYQIPAAIDGDAPRQAVFIDDIDNYDAESQPVPGDTVLIFLKRNGKALELADHRDGVRKISPVDAPLFSERIYELKSIFSAKKADIAAITEWLVRCAEEPATRWDGAYELLESFRQLDRNGKTVQTAGAASYDRVEFARALTDRQKTELASILIYRKGSEANFVRGDRELIELVRRWGGPTYATFVLDRIKYGQMTAVDNSFLMTMLAETIADRRAANLARLYSRLTFDVDRLGDQTERRRTSVSQNDVLARFVSHCERLLTEIAN